MIYPLLIKAPSNHNSSEFLQFLRENNEVIMDEGEWLVIKNCKYHTEKTPWYTAFWKGPTKDSKYWWESVKVLHEVFGEWEWLKKSASKQTVRRFHFHLVKRG